MLIFVWRNVLCLWQMACRFAQMYLTGAVFGFSLLFFINLRATIYAAGEVRICYSQNMAFSLIIKHLSKRLNKLR